MSRCFRGGAAPVVRPSAIGKADRQMNFYASSDYLQVVADVYFPDRSTRIGCVAIGGEILRVLIVDDRDVVTEVPFLDYHLPLDASEAGRVEHKRAFAPWVAQGIVTREGWPAIAREGLEPAPYVDWSDFESYDRYLAALRSEHKDRLAEHGRLRRRLVEKHGVLEFRFNDERPDVLDLAIQWKRGQFEETGADDVFVDPRNLRFFEVLRERGLLAASTLRASGRLLAVSLGFVHEGVWSGWILSYDHDPDLKHYSLGNQLLHSMLQHGFESGHRQFDFSIGGHAYKWLYATHARILAPLGRPPRKKRQFASPRTVTRNALERLNLLEAAKSLRQRLRAFRP
jgi:hypothetical protein